MKTRKFMAWYKNSQAMRKDCKSGNFFQAFLKTRMHSRFRRKVVIRFLRRRFSLYTSQETVVSFQALCKTDPGYFESALSEIVKCQTACSKMFGYGLSLTLDKLQLANISKYGNLISLYKQEFREQSISRLFYHMSKNKDMTIEQEQCLKDLFLSFDLTTREMIAEIVPFYLEWL